MQLLCSRVAHHRGVVLIEAPTGYGKSALLACLDELEGPFERVTGSGLPHVMDLPNNVGSILVDDEADIVSCELLEAMAGSAPLAESNGVLVLAGRDFSHLGRWAQHHDVLRIGPNELAMTREDITELAGGVLGAEQAETFSGAVFTHSHGWPALVVAMLRDVAQSGPGHQGIPSPRWDRGQYVQQLVDTCTGGLGPEMSHAAAQLAHLTVFSERCVAAMVGPEGLASLLAAGLPVVKRSDGWLHIPRPVEDALRAQSNFELLSAELLGPILVAGGGLVFAAKSLIAAGSPAVAADLLCSVPGYHFDDHDPSEVAGMIRSLDSQLAPDPELSLLLARVHHNRAEIDEQRRALQEAERRAVDVGDERRRLEALAEQLFLDLGQGTDRGLAARLHYLEDQVGPETMPSTRVRLREVRAMYLAQSPVLADVYLSITLFKDTSYEWEGLGEPGRAACTLRLFAGTACLHLGRYREAAAALDRACLLVQDRPTSLVKTLELSARFAALSGDSERHRDVSSRARSLLPGLSLDWINGFLSWSTMVMRSLESDADASIEAYQRTESMLGTLWGHHTAVVFLADAARCFAYLGDVESALSALARADTRRGEAPLEVDLAELVVHARVGDAEVVHGLAQVLKRSGELPFERRWAVEFEELVAESRLEGVSPPPAQLAELELKAREAGLFKAWALLVDTTQSVVDAVPQVTSLVLLGSFEVVGSDSEELAPGHSTQLVKYLATAGGDVPVDVVIEVLWPEGDPAKGRKRLRNVINRTRTALGQESVIRRGDLIRLGSGIQTDLAHFREIGGSALTGGGSAEYRALTAVGALNLYGGELLPEDLYQDWASGQRETARMTAVGLLDLVIAHPPTDIEPSWLLATASRIGAKTEDLWVAVALFAEQADSFECCRTAVLQAAAAARDLGYEPNSETRRLLADHC